MQPDEPAKPIHPIHPDAIICEERMGRADKGDFVSYSELAKLCHKTPDDKSIRYRVKRAATRLKNNPSTKMMFKIGHVDDATGERGVIRLRDNEAVDFARDKLDGASRSNRRILSMLSCVDVEALSPEKKIDYEAIGWTASVAQRLSSAKGVAVAQRFIANSRERIPELANVWKALTSGN